MQPNTSITNEAIFKKLLEIENNMSTKVDLADVKKDIESLASATAKGFVGLEERLTKKIDNLNSKVDDVENNLTDQVEKLASMTKEALEHKVDRLEYA